MCGFIAQLVEHRTGIAEVTGSNPVEALIFFRLLLSNCLNWKIYCDDHISLSEFHLLFVLFILPDQVKGCKINRTFKSYPPKNDQVRKAESSVVKILRTKLICGAFPVQNQLSSPIRPSPIDPPFLNNPFAVVKKTHALPSLLRSCLSQEICKSNPHITPSYASHILG